MRRGIDVTLYHPFNTQPMAFVNGNVNNGITRHLLNVTDSWYFLRGFISHNLIWLVTYSNMLGPDNFFHMAHDAFSFRLHPLFIYATLNMKVYWAVEVKSSLLACSASARWLWYKGYVLKFSPFARKSGSSTTLTFCRTKVLSERVSFQTLWSCLLMPTFSTGSLRACIACRIGAFCTCRTKLRAASFWNWWLPVLKAW